MQEEREIEEERWERIKKGREGAKVQKQLSD